MSIVATPLFARLLEMTPFSERELVVLIATAPLRYKDHYIQKRHGGKRLISQPTKEIKYLQRLLVSRELSALPVHEAATAYRPGKSTLDHASPHARAKYLLKLDFKDFFLSLTNGAIEHRLQLDTDYSRAERWMLCNLLCRQSKRESGPLRLAVGAPSSPYVANYLLSEFDSKLGETCDTLSVRYTRYADDMAFSTSIPNTLHLVHEKVQELLVTTAYLGLDLNPCKTVNVSSRYGRYLVGLTLSNDGLVSVGRDEKRRLRAALHQLKMGSLPPDERPRLIGQLAYVYGVDPLFIDTLCKHFGYVSIGDVVRRQTNTA